MQQYDVQGEVGQLRNMKVDQFPLHMFNCLIYNCEISGPLAANTLLGLWKYYISEKSLKMVNLKNL